MFTNMKKKARWVSRFFSSPGVRGREPPADGASYLRFFVGFVCVFGVMVSRVFSIGRFEILSIIINRFNLSIAIIGARQLETMNRFVSTANLVCSKTGLLC